MKKKYWKLFSMLLLACLLALSANGCSGKEEEPEPEVEEPLYPVSIRGTEIRVGETTVQALLDAGMEVTWSEMTSDMQIEEYVVDPEMELEANSYYSGASIWVTDSTFAHISFVTDEEAVRMGDAVIARLEFGLSFNEEDKEAQSEILFDGIPVTELNREKAGEHFPDFTGDNVQWFSTGLRDYDYSMGFYSTSTELTRLSVERNYDVDWSSGS